MAHLLQDNRVPGAVEGQRAKRAAMSPDALREVISTTVRETLVQMGVQPVQFIEGVNETPIDSGLAKEPARARILCAVAIAVLFGAVVGAWLCIR